MGRKRTKISAACAAAVLSILALSCNVAPDGYNAPAGSEVTLPEDATVATDSEFFLIITLNVTIPIGVATSTTTAASGPGDNIYVVGICTACTIYDWTGDDGRAQMDMTKISAVANPYPFKTNKQGSYTLVVGVEAPANLGVADTYDAQFSANIGVTSADMKITVEDFTE